MATGKKNPDTKPKGNKKNMQKTILIADDSPTMRMMLLDILSEEGYQVLTATDGIHAAVMAFKHHPDLIISDIEMPNMNGYQACRLLKNDPVTSMIPVIILTSKSGSGSVFWGYQTGADLYLLKDFKPAQLTDAIARLLNEYEARALVPAEGIPLSEEVDEMQIMAKLNDFMDNRLFEMTLINEISQLTVNLTSMSGTLTSLLDVLDKAIDNYIIGFIIFSDDKEILVSIKLNQETPRKQLEVFEYLSLEDLALSTNSDLTEFSIEMELQDEAKIIEEPEEPVEFNPNLIYSVPLRTREITLGILNVYHPQMPSVSLHQKQMLEKLTPYISTAIDTVAMHNKIKNLSVIDGLTQLYNRRYIIEIFKNEFNKSIRYNHDLSLIMIDIDNFKPINDTHGHLSGDLVLKTMTGIIKRLLRSVDLPGRYGGEEFIVILPDTNKESALVVAERIREQVADMRFKTINGESLTVTISLGLADIKDLESKANEIELIKIADSRLYKAKRTGKNKVVSS